MNHNKDLHLHARSTKRHATRYNHRVKREDWADSQSYKQDSLYIETCVVAWIYSEQHLNHDQAKPLSNLTIYKIEISNHSILLKNKISDIISVLKISHS